MASSTCHTLLNGLLGHPGVSFIPALGSASGYQYSADPEGAPCICSTVSYSVISACALCQKGNWPLCVWSDPSYQY